MPKKYGLSGKVDWLDISLNKRSINFTFNNNLDNQIIIVLVYPDYLNKSKQIKKLLDEKNSLSNRLRIIRDHLLDIYSKDLETTETKQTDIPDPILNMNFKKNLV